MLDNSELVYGESKDKTFNLLIKQLETSLVKVSSTASLIDNADQFEEKREDEKQTIQTAIDILACMGAANFIVED